MKEFLVLGSYQNHPYYTYFLASSDKDAVRQAYEMGYKAIDLVLPPSAYEKYSGRIVSWRT